MGNHSRPAKPSLELRGPAVLSVVQSCSLGFQLVLNRISKELNLLTLYLKRIK